MPKKRIAKRPTAFSAKVGAFAERLGSLYFPLSLGLSILAYGLLTPWLGLYWDDWPLSWNASEFGAAVYQGFAPYRPLSGWLYFFLFSLLGTNVLGWHLFALLARWLSGLAFNWVLRIVWPKETALVTAASLLFLLYPGFSQQSISVTYGPYFVYYILFLGSLGLMLLSARGGEKAAWYTAGSLALGLACILSTEYFYGLDLLRPVLIWLVVKPKNGRERRSAIVRWAPYGALFVAGLAWRYWASLQTEALYGTVLLDQIAAEPWSRTLAWLQTALGDVVEAGLLAWGRVSEAWAGLEANSRSSLLYFPVVLLGAGLAAMATWRDGKDTPSIAGKLAMGLGCLALLVSGLSFWVADLPLRLFFPLDRFTIPMMFGSSLLAAGAWSLLPKQAFRYVVLGLLLGLCAGFHFVTANEYRQEWEQQAQFARQLAWRAPALAGNTAFITAEIDALPHNTDNSLTALVNWMYADADKVTRTLKYGFFFAQLRSSSGLLGLKTGDGIYEGFDFVRYEGTADHVVLILYQPPSCLRVIDPEMYALHPQFPEELRELLSYSHPDLILDETSQASERLPFFDLSPRGTWCYYFEKADLARQMGDWEEVVRLGDLGFALEDSPNSPTERTPFIEGYAMLGRNQRALELTSEALKINPRLQRMLCALWARMAGNGVDPAAAESAFELLSCEP